METMKCPYCECKVSLIDVETDDGTCPECGAPLVGSLLFDQLADDHDEDEDETAPTFADDMDDEDEDDVDVDDDMDFDDDLDDE